MDEATRPAQRATRSDATANRDRILDAARRLLQEDADVSMAAVGREAGVSQGTLYRHFSSRDALVMTIHREDVSRLARDAIQLLQDHPPWEALDRWLVQLADFGRVKQGMSHALQTATLGELAEKGTDLIVAAIDELIAACRAVDGRPIGIDGLDVLHLVSFLWHLEPEVWNARWRALLDVVLAGLHSVNPRVG